MHTLDTYAWWGRWAFHTKSLHCIIYCVWFNAHVDTHTLRVNSLKYFYLGEILVLLTPKWIVMAAIDFEAYGPNFWQWPAWISVRYCPTNIFRAACISRFVRNQGGRWAEGTNGVRFIRIPVYNTILPWSGFCSVQTIRRHISGEILQWNLYVTTTSIIRFITCD